MSLSDTCYDIKFSAFHLQKQANVPTYKINYQRSGEREENGNWIISVRRNIGWCNCKALCVSDRARFRGPNNDIRTCISLSPTLFASVCLCSADSLHVARRQPPVPPSHLPRLTIKGRFSQFIGTVVRQDNDQSFLNHMPRSELTMPDGKVRYSGQHGS